MKENYHKALATMTELNNLERERMQMNAPVSHQELVEKYGQEILQRFQAVHEAYLKSGKSREKYIQRLEIEFRNEELERSDFEMIDSYFEHKRWVKQKEKAMLRDLQRDKHALRERTTFMIEEQVEEARLKL